MSLVPETHALPMPRGAALLLAALGPVAVGAILAVRGGTPTPLIAVPAVVFGVVGATSPALYIASAATGAAPSLGAVVRAFGVALAAFGIALAGLLLPAAFLALSSVARDTAVVVATAAVGAAALLGLRRLATELATDSIRPSIGASSVFVIWACATLGIAGRLWWDLARQVTS
jgi:hypothetical protein